MLYVTTRNNTDVLTAHRTLQESRASDGGLFLPFRMPNFTDEDLRRLSELTLNQRIAEILNQLFPLHLSGWDLDFSVGRYPVRLTQRKHRIHFCECWHNPDWKYQRLEHNLAQRLQGAEKDAGNWVKIAIRIAVLFGVFGELRQQGIASADISLVSGNFSAAISAWYARQWGLPIENIVCCCNENHTLWNLVKHGQFRTDMVSIATDIPDADITLPDDLERLICACGGIAEVERYLDACRQGKIYCASEDTAQKLRNGLHVSVISSQRIDQIIRNVHRTHQYLLSPYSAMAYAGLLDYRAQTGSTRPAVVLCDAGPGCYEKRVAAALGISEAELHTLL